VRGALREGRLAKRGATQGGWRFARAGALQAEALCRRRRFAEGQFLGGRFAGGYRFAGWTSPEGRFARGRFAGGRFAGGRFAGECFARAALF